MPTIRESITLDPITTERLDTMGNIHRYNFGWVKTHKIVGDGSPVGQVVDSSTTGISGMAMAFSENTAQEILPPALETPDVAPTTQMASSIVMGSFFKVGIKMRSMVRARAIGTSEILIMGQQAYAINETKEYADAIGNPAAPASPASGVEAAEGGVTITIANGVNTKTLIKG